METLVDALGACDGVVFCPFGPPTTAASVDAFCSHAAAGKPFIVKWPDTPRAAFDAWRKANAVVRVVMAVIGRDESHQPFTVASYRRHNMA